MTCAGSSNWTVRHESADNTRADDVKEAVQRRRGTLLFFAGGVGSVVIVRARADRQ